MLMVCSVSGREVEGRDKRMVEVSGKDESM